MGICSCLQTLLWHDEIREASFPSLETAPPITERELALSSALMESFVGDFQPETFTDEYQEELRKLIAAKIERGESVGAAETFGGEASPAKAGGGEVIDLMEALQRSVERSRRKTSSAKPAAEKPAAGKNAATASAKKTRKPA